MTTCPESTTLHELVDDELDTTAREAVEAHVATCERCTAELRSIVELIDRASRLPRTIAPPRDLWPSIRDRATADGSTRAARFARGGWLAAAASVALLLAAWLALDAARDGRETDGPAKAASAAALEPSATADDELDRLAAEYADASARLLEALDRRGATLPAEDRAELDRSLALIDGAIEAVREEIDGGADHPDGRRALRALYRRKVDVLWRVARLAS